MLPDWPEGTVTILATLDEAPHAIPVSAAIRAGARHVLIGLAPSRGSLERLRRNAAVALLVVSKETAITAHGRARVLGEELAGGVLAVLIEIDHVQDHDRPTFEIPDGISWRWTDPSAEARDEEVRTGLRNLADQMIGELER